MSVEYGCWSTVSNREGNKKSTGLATSSLQGSTSTSTIDREDRCDLGQPMSICYGVVVCGMVDRR